MLELWTSNLKIHPCVRYAKHYLEDKVEKRTLLKVFGIRIDIIVQSLVSSIYFPHWTEGGCEEALHLHHYLPSQARKFNIIPTLTAIGSGVGIFGVVCPALTNNNTLLPPWIFV